MLGIYLNFIIIYAWAHLLNLEIEISKQMYFNVGQPIFLLGSPLAIFTVIIQLTIIIGLAFILSKNLKWYRKIYVCVAVVSVAIFIALPNIITYRGSSHCHRLEVVSNNMLDKATSYFRIHPDTEVLPKVTDIVERVPPGFSVEIFRNENERIEMIVKIKRNQCPKFDSVTKYVQI